MAQGPGRTPPHRFVAFRHARFRAEVPDEDIDRRSPGEDCSRWLHARLLAADGVAPSVAPFEEDWGGWNFAIRVDAVGF